jgi:hypothetical protein
MSGIGMNACTICGGLRTAEDRWFLVTENRWEDKLKVLRWNERFASRGGVHGVCSAPHVRELVVHWMTTGSLNYPFAWTVPPLPWRARRLGSMRRENTDMEPSGIRIGELAVHRESVGRALSENPQSLNVILDELLSVLRREAGEISNEAEVDDEILCASAEEM